MLVFGLLWGRGVGVAVIKLINQLKQTYYTRDGGRYE